VRPPAVLASLAIVLFVAVPALVSAAANAASVRVRLTERGCALSERTISAGGAVFRIDNRSRRVGRFTIARRQSRAIRRGGRATLRVTLAPGRHAYRCLPRGRGTLTATAPPPEHRIGVRVTNGVGELYDRASGRTFVARGNNYVRLAAKTTSDGSSVFDHANFDPGRYDAARTDAAFERMQREGYNTVRVFLSNVSLGDRATGGLSAGYVSNLADFLRRAKAHGLFVIVTTDWLPSGTRYEQLLNTAPRGLVDDVNLSYLTAEGVEANARFWRDLATALLARRAPLDALLAYELRNELFFVADKPPFSLSAGTLRAPNGTTYDLGSAEDRRRLLEESLVFWIDRMRSAIRAVDPTALVTVGFFWPQEPNPTRIGDPRLIYTRAAIERSTADFVDLHAYPGLELTFRQFMENYGVPGPTQKPLLLGEFGAFRFAYPAPDEAATALQDVQAESCRYGFDGWLLWTWDTDEQPELWNGLSGDAAIDRALAPATRPDPCAPPTGPRNVALGKPASASLSLSANPPSLAVDGLKDTLWVSGDFAPQSLEIDLQAPFAVSRIRLAVAQTPAGATVHRLFVREAGSSEYQLVREFSGVTADGDVLEYVPAAPRPGIRFVRIETLASPSWVSWREIEVVGTG
jgi:hypothetical protein